MARITYYKLEDVLNDAKNFEWHIEGLKKFGKKILSIRDGCILFDMFPFFPIRAQPLSGYDTEKRLNEWGRCLASDARDTAMKYERPIIEVSEFELVATFEDGEKISKISYQILGWY